MHIKSWSMAINNDEATLDDPPMNLTLHMMPARRSESNPYRREKKSPSPSSKANSSSSSSVLALPYPGLGYSPYHMPAYPPCHSQYPMHGLHRRSPRQSPRSTSRAYNHVDDILGSSPPPELDPTERLEKYFAWLVSRSQLQADLFHKAETALKKAGHTFTTMFSITEQKWIEWDIPEGIAFQIRSGKTKFKSIESSIDV